MKINKYEIVVNDGSMENIETGEEASPEEVSRLIEESRQARPNDGGIDLSSFNI